VQRSLKHYNLQAILAIGYRVRSPRGTAFRQWATSRLSELLVKGFTLDDERINLVCILCYVRSLLFKPTSSFPCMPSVARLPSSPQLGGLGSLGGSIS
jgi:hypothetical protein